MGCAYSRVEKEEAVRRCKERKRLMKQLVTCRSELAVAHLAYLQSLRNTGATLRQFMEDDTVIPGVVLSPSPLQLPPSPPPPPPFSPDSRRDVDEGDEKERGGRGREQDEHGSPISRNIDEEANDIDDDGEICPPPPPPAINTTWNYWDPFDQPTTSKSSSPVTQKKANGASVEAAEDENWAETKTDFDEEEVSEVGQNGLDSRDDMMSKPARMDVLIDDNSSAMSWLTKDSEMAMIGWQNKKTMTGIVKELDDYFLKASAGGTQVVALLESNRSSFLHQNFTTKGKSNKSAKVFSSLSWRWSSRSLLSTKDAIELQAAEICRSVSHCTTLDKLFTEEQRLYNEVKEEEAAKMKHRRMSLLLRKQEGREDEWTKTEKTRASIEELQSRIRSIEDSISRTCLSISKLRDEELHSQLNDLCSGLMHMWRTMYECHQVQNHIAQQANYLPNHPSTEATSESHRYARVELESELTSWYNNFHKLLKAQREYAHTLNQWVRLTDCLPDSNGLFGNSSGLYSLCEEWHLALERLPEKVASEAIKSFISVIHSIGLQLIDEHDLRKKSELLEKRLEKEMNSFGEMEKGFGGISIDDIVSGALDSKPVTGKHAKLNVLKKKAEDEKAKYINSIRDSRSMTLNNLQTSLPNVFQAMTGFAGLCVQAFEGIHRHHTGTGVPGHANCPSPL